MLDLIIGPFLEYSPLGDLNKTSVDGKDEFWYNSKVDITFGDTTTWLIGLGRITNVCGPDLKIIADWTFFIDKLMGKVASKLPKTKKYLDVLSGTGGSTDVIFGVKDLINYGHTQDTNIIRKNTAPLEIKIFKDKLKPGESLFPKALIALIVLPYLTLLTIVVTSRFAFMQVGIFSEEKLRKQVKGALNLSAPLIESRWVAGLKVYETFNFTAYNLKKAVDTLKKMTDNVLEESNKHAEKLSLLAQNVLITSTLKKQIEDQTKIIKDFLKSNLKDFKEIKIDAEDAIKVSAKYLGGISQEITQSNIGLHATFKSLRYNTEEKIKLDVTKDDKSSSSIELTPSKINIGSAGVTFQLGSIAGTDGNFHFSSSDPKAFISLGFDNSISDMTILKEYILIRSGKSPEKTPTIELEEGKLKLRCGSAISNPEIVIDNDKVTITAGNQTLGTGPKFVMTKDSIELTVGAITEESSLKISPKGIDIECGLFTSTNWNSKGITQSVAENRLQMTMVKLEEKVAMLQAKVDAVTKLESVLSNLDTAAIEKLKSALRNFL